MCFTSVEKFCELWSINDHERDTIKKFGIFTIRVKMATSLTSCSSENRKNFEKKTKQNKPVNLRYVGYIAAKFH